MSEEIIKVLDALCAKFGVAIDWTSQNVLSYTKELIEKFIRYEIATSIMWAILGIALFVICVIVAKIFIPKAIEDYWYESYYVLPAILSILAGMIAFLVFFKQACDITTCLAFPEKMIFDYIQNIK